jgi:Uma2 family endonuclease
MARTSYYNRFVGSVTTQTTVEEFLRLPDPRSGHLELHHGEVVHIPPPKLKHTQVQEHVRALLRRICREDNAVMVEFPFRPTSDFNVWVADEAVISREGMDRANPDEYFPGAPELVIEVLSPANTKDEIDEKKAICLENGCRCFWVINPKRKEVEVTEENVTRQYKYGMTFTCKTLRPGVVVRVDELLPC